MQKGLIDLASEMVGAEALQASDEFFAPKENLLRAAEPVFVADKFTDLGKWMDGWESRRKRAAGYDWCVIRLGLQGILRTIDVDTRYFLGNFPSHCSLDAAATTGVPKERDWKTVLVKSRLQGDSHNLFDVNSSERFTHVRLNIFPDGGVARLRVHGVVVPDIAKLRGAKTPPDLASIVNGGRVIASSDQFFGQQHNLILPGRPANMGGGWETRRRRGPGYDWIIIQLGAPGDIQKVAVETQHYKGNYPDRCSIDACDAPGALEEDLATGRVAWTEILPAAKLEADSVHMFQRELLKFARATHVRLSIYPDGGVSRLRVFAKILE